MNSLRVPLGVCLAFAAGLAAASPAAATFAAPFDLSAAGRDATEPEVAVAADGDAVFAWTRDDGSNTRVQARFRSAAGALSPVQTLSGVGQDAADVQVAIDATGDAVFVWERFDGANVLIEARARSAAGVLSPVETLSAAGRDASDPDVDVDLNGDAVFVWERFDGANVRIEARARSTAGVLSPVQTVSPAGDSARVGVDNNGDAVFTWLVSDGSNLRVRTRARSAAGVLSSARTLSGGGQDAAEPVIGVDPTGDAVFGWLRSDGTDTRIQARARSAAGVLSPVQTLSAAGQSAFTPALGVDATGAATLAWQRSDGFNFRIQARTRAASGALGPVQILSTPGTGAFVPQVSVDGGGGATFAWLQAFGGAFVPVARERTAAGSLLASQILSDGGSSAVDLQVGFGGGVAAVGWYRQDGTALRVQTAIGP